MSVNPQMLKTVKEVRPGLEKSLKSSSSSSRYAMSEGSPKYSSRCGLGGPRNLQLERTLFGNRLPEPELFRRPEERQGLTRQKLLDKALPETAIALMETACAERLRYERFDESSARIFAESTRYSAISESFDELSRRFLCRGTPAQSGKSGDAETT